MSNRSFINLIHSAEAEVLCPHCGYNYTHQGEVNIYERGEDQLTGNHVRVLDDKITVDRDISKNPSPRRHGVAIDMRCETGHDFKLNIYQHKGNTYISVE
ncbi:hypothetical protein WKI25_08935 [Acinetobacter baumannii]